ncbi:MAG: helix-hairpin-helix domain-containing protein [Pedobacter sp.]|nr:MAG: helix-hairpin-helix domain-containing protein [Pedobacter sp.]
MSCKKLLLVLVCCFCFQNIHAQDIDVEQIIESIAQNNTADIDYSELAGRLNSYQRNPIRINKASKEQLEELVFLNPLQINALIDYRITHGPLISLLELQSIDGFDSETIRRLVHFVTLGKPKRASDELAQNNPVTNGKHDLIFHYGRILEQKKGFGLLDQSRSSYLGCPNRLVARYRFNSGRTFSGSLNMEKDAGEPFFIANNQEGFDFYSGHVMIKDWGRVNKLIIGDYALQFGEGLTLWSGLSFGKGSEMLTLAKQDVGLKPYTSINENSFFRGLAASLDMKPFRFTSFVSYKRIDATLKDQKITSLSSSGLHRTFSEIAAKNSTTQFLFGSNLQYSNRGLTIGLTTYRSHYGHAFEAGKYLYNQSNFSGSDLTNVGLNYNYTVRNTYFFGEVAYSGSGYAFLNGMISALSPGVSLSLLHRNYQRNYYSFYNHATSEAAGATNESGFYVGLAIVPNSRWEWFGYVDLYQFPGLKLKVDVPSRGYEMLGQLSYKLSKKLKWIIRYKSETKEENDVLKNALNTLVQVRKQNYRFEINTQLSDRFSFRKRFELIQVQKTKAQADWGHLVYQDIKYSPLKSKFSGSFRVAYFYTPNYDARIYAYENDVLYTYSTQMYQNKGVRYYFNGRYTIQKGLDLWLKYSIIRYLEQNTIGSGLDQINGNMRSEIRLQLRYQF